MSPRDVSFLGELFIFAQTQSHSSVVEDRGQQVSDQMPSKCCILKEEVGMPFIRMQVRNARTFAPDREIGIGAQWRSIGQQIRELANEVRSVGASFEGSWEGNAKERFAEQYLPELGRIAACADQLEHLAHRIESLSVTVWETSWETVWVPEGQD